MGQQNEKNEIKEEDKHMYEVLKKENDVLKQQIINLNSNNKNNGENYDTLLSMMEVLSMQREKILSIKNGNKNIINI